MKNYILLFVGLMLFVSCENEDIQSNPKLCSDEYFYYSGGSKTFLKHSLNEVWIVFKQSDLTGELAKSILEKYSFISTDNISSDSFSGKTLAIINENCNCSDFKNYLEELNKDNEISSATPVFYLSDVDPMSYWILLSEVLTKNDNERITESEFVEYAETLNLELIESNYSTQHFKVKDVETGFEALEIANEIYESGKAQYSHPNFIAHMTLF
ncbi:MAG TPA: hypothetical protein PK005_08745 [Bacteroidales bacterium]|jgi:hypothetical protein|nr:hypothetical protein [Bacteroidales bacterium]MDI9532551.1 hypothetical protein [Bacteroidota bacterium]OPZ57955.1 MAG: hypothetical protein BWY89_00289 [Bacteroidetes bacterium ADurb.BinA012]TAH59956.1 MAG: hypothetical protein EWM46_10900 [Fermentimonas caenicola]MBK7732588.1 hypothetical protein [Bacteroidales bacterium]